MKKYHDATNEKRDAKKRDTENHTLNNSQSNIIGSPSRMPVGNSCKIKTNSNPIQNKRTISKSHDTDFCWHGKGGTNYQFAHSVLRQNPLITQQRKKEKPHWEIITSQSEPAEKVKQRTRSYTDAVKASTVNEKNPLSVAQQTV